jgi:hypothetical protein
MKKSMIAIDGSCLIAVQLNEPLSEKLEHHLINDPLSENK